MISVCFPYSEIKFYTSSFVKRKRPILFLLAMLIIPLNCIWAFATYETDDANTTAFITKWETTADNESITIPTTGSGYNYDVDWGDGNSSTTLTGNASHTYTSPGVHTVTITGSFPRIYFNNTGDKLKIISIEQWGNIQWTSMANAFMGASNLTYNAIDSPDLSLSNNMSGMFRNASSIDGDFSNWDVSSITRMDKLFYAATNFNGDISAWNVSMVNNMNSMFREASSFNKDLSSWDVKNVISFSRMFWQATSFDNNIFDIDTTSVASNFSYMFYYATSFNQDLGSWDISSATNMFNMLKYCGLDLTNYDNTISGWASQVVPTNIVLGADGLEYCDSEIDHNTLTSAPNNWTINGDILNCPFPTDAFITTWNISSSSYFEVTIPTTGSGYDYQVDWGDGTITTNHMDSATHTYSETGIYTIIITGDFPRIYFNNSGNRLRISSIEQWGTIEWKSMANAFWGASNLTNNATDVPNLSQVSNTSNMFRNAFNFDGDLSDWDVSNVTRMENMFNNASKFESDISNWNVSNVTRMESMFYGASNFNSDISNWDVSNVTRMDKMFYNAMSFNSDISNWVVDEVHNMNSMFRNANSFNSDILNWDVDQVTSFARMFWDASNFNGNIFQLSESAEATNFSYMFYNADMFNQSLGNWNISNATNMYNMLKYSGLDIENYDSTISGWAMQSIPSNINLGADGLQYCNSEMDRTTLLSAPNNWTITGDLSGCNESLIPFVTTWEVNANDLTITIPTIEDGYDYDVTWGDGNTSINQTGDVTHTYASAGIYTVSITRNFPRIYFTIGNLDRLKIKSIEQWGNIKWSNMNYAFRGTSNLIYNAIDVPDLSAVTKMNSMFQGATNFDGNLSDWDVSNVQFMHNMFQDAVSFNGDISNWDVSNVKNMTQMFSGASSFNRDLNWDVSRVITLRLMFNNAINFNGALPNWDLSKASNLIGMFAGCQNFNQDLSSWVLPTNPSINLNLGIAFAGATSFNQDLSTWNMSRVTVATGMLDNTALDVENYDNTLIGWSTQILRPNVTLGAFDLEYCEGEMARNLLQNAPNNWNITGDFGGCGEIGIPFITTWETTTTNESITMYTNGSGYFVDWGDGIISSNEMGSATHTYDSPGLYTVTVYGPYLPPNFF